MVNTSIYFPSSFNVYFSCKSLNYVFNTWHGNLIAIEKDAFDSLKCNHLSSISTELFDDLVKMGFLTTETNEFAKVLEENSRHQEIIEKNNFSICILPTLRCNASCYYCFESGINGCKDLDEKIEEHILNYIKTEGVNKKIHITWFGGEPLVGSETINRICDSLRSSNIEFTSGIITNGFFIDDHITDMKEKWNLRRAQITLDDVGEKYNQIKKMGKNGFEKVISNIHLLIDNKIKVSLRINYNSESLGDYREIVDFVYREFGNKVQLYFHDIIGKDFKTPDEVDGKPLLKLYKCLSSYGYIRSLRDLRIQRKYAACSINKKNYINVFPGGWTDKCEHFVGKKSIFDCGNITSNDFNPGKVFNSVRKQCSTCKCFPICGGGCYANHLMRERAGCFRGHSYLDEILKFYVEEVLEDRKMNDDKQEILNNIKNIDKSLDILKKEQLEKCQPPYGKMDEEIGKEIKNLKDKIDGLLDYWKDLYLGQN